MRAIPRFVYLFCFIGIAIVAAVALNRVVEPSMATILTRALFLAAVCGAPGLIHRRLWPVALVLLPVGCYLLIRTIMPVPELVDGVAEQYRYYVEQLNLGASAYKTAVFPLDLASAPELRLLLAFVVYWLTGAAAFLALSLRRPAPAVVLLLVLLGYSLTVDSDVRVTWPGLLFVVLAACLFVASRGMRRRGWRLRDAAAGGLIGVVASFLALGLLTAAPSVVATPWQDWRTWDPLNAGGSVYSFNWLQNYPRLLDPANDVVIMKVDSPSPSYWRASALDSFTGTAWVTSQAFLQRIEAIPQGPSDADGHYDSYLYRIPVAEPTPPGKTVTQAFHIQSVYTNYFFTGGDPRSLTLDQDVALRMNDMRSLRVSAALGPTLRYNLIAVVPEVAPTDLVGLQKEYSEDLDGYLTLPFDHLADIEGQDKETAWRSTITDTGPEGWEWLELFALNQRIVRDAVDPYQITLRIERYLRQFYSYSLDLPASEYSSPYAAFLFDHREGYCQHFAGAMALLLRFNGIPSRVAVGFTSGEDQGDQTYLVSTNNAHAWVEVYFPTVGWVAFDPTPGRNLPTAGASSTSPGFINPFVDADTSAGGALPTSPPQDALPESGPDEGVNTDTGEDGGLSGASWLPWVAAAVAVIVGWPLVRSLRRRRHIHRGPLERRFEASLALLKTHLSEYHAPVGPADTLEETLVVLRDHLDIDADPAFLDRANAVLFGGRPATPDDVEQAERLRRRTRTRLRERHGWTRTVMTWYGLSGRRGGSELQYRDDKSGRATQEAAGIHLDAL